MAGAGYLRSVVVIGLLPAHDQGGAAVPRAERAARAVRERDVAVLHLDFGMSLTAELSNRLDHLRETAAIGRMVVAEPAAVGVERQLADARDQVAVGDELAALPLRRKAQILERDQHGDREAVVDRYVLDVGMRHAGLGERRGSGPDRARVGQVDL